MKVRRILFVLVALPLTAAWTNVARRTSAPATCCWPTPRRCRRPVQWLVAAATATRATVATAAADQAPIPGMEPSRSVSACACRTTTFPAGPHGGWPAPAIASHDFNFFDPDDARIYLSGSAYGGLVKGTLDTALAGGGTTFGFGDNVVGRTTSRKCVCWTA